jgi:hypothetical protein
LAYRWESNCGQGQEARAQAMGVSGVWACRREDPSGVGGWEAVRGGAGTGDRCERMTKASGEQPGAPPTIVHDS